MSMAETIVYIKLDRNIEVQNEDVFLSDAGSIRCKDSTIAAKIKAIKIHKFHKNEQKRCVISVLKIIEMIENTCPGVIVDNLGETDVLVEWVSVNKHKSRIQGWKAALVALVSFFGTAFTIMAYHNDIGIVDVFAEIHRIVMGQEPQGVTVLEIAYSIGLGLGIIVFFNHIGGRKLTKDPTPIEVALRKYETDVDTTLIDTAGREGKTIDVD